MRDHAPKKSLGQHFLTSEAAVAKMVAACGCKKGDTVLEIGPGRGVLTAALLATGAKVIAIELDRELAEGLEARFSQELASGQFRIEYADILTLDDPSLRDLVGSIYRVCANIPYYITNAIIEKFLSAQTQPVSMTILIQKEVAERIVARDGKHSILSVAVQAYAKPKIISRVLAGSFNPPPKVDSAILHLEPINREYFKTAPTINEDRFFTIMKAGFAHKRKMLTGNLTSIGIERASTEDALRTISLSEKARAEDLTLAQWRELISALSA
jgi:16S rRNA (adenine1518-N6/adenine1519-N6)-dimethyltransferase